MDWGTETDIFVAEMTQNCALVYEYDSKGAFRVQVISHGNFGYPQLRFTCRRQENR